MKNLSFLTLFAFLSVGFVVADEPVDEDVEVVAEATTSQPSIPSVVVIAVTFVLIGLEHSASVLNV